VQEPSLLGNWKPEESACQLIWNEKNVFRRLNFENTAWQSWLFFLRVRTDYLGTRAVAGFVWPYIARDSWSQDRETQGGTSPQVDVIIAVATYVILWYVEREVTEQRNWTRRNYRLEMSTHQFFWRDISYAGPQNSRTTALEISIPLAVACEIMMEWYTTSLYAFYINNSPWNLFVEHGQGQSAPSTANILFPKAQWTGRIRILGIISRHAKLFSRAPWSIRFKLNKEKAETHGHRRLENT
jgi:hypothetical protein